MSGRDGSLDQTDMDVFVDPLNLVVSLVRRLLIGLGLWPDPPQVDPLRDSRPGDGSGVFE